MVEVILQQWDEVQNDNNNRSSNSNDEITTHSNIFIDEVGRRWFLYITPQSDLTVYKKWVMR